VCFSLSKDEKKEKQRSGAQSKLDQYLYLQWRGMPDFLPKLAKTERKDEEKELPVALRPGKCLHTNFSYLRRRLLCFFVLVFVK
jgi:hypothetical protein